jgi:hypothetical protein
MLRSVGGTSGFGSGVGSGTGTGAGVDTGGLRLLGLCIGRTIRRRGAGGGTTSEFAVAGSEVGAGVGFEGPGLGVAGATGFDIGFGLTLAGAAGFAVSFTSGFTAGFGAASGFGLSCAFAGNQANEICNSRPRKRTAGAKTDRRTDPRIEVHEFLIIGR